MSEFIPSATITGGIKSTEPFNEPVKVLGNLSKAQLSRFEENRSAYPGASLEARGRRR